MDPKTGGCILKKNIKLMDAYYNDTYSFSHYTTITCGNLLYLIGMIWTNNATCQNIIHTSQYVCHNIKKFEWNKCISLVWYLSSHLCIIYIFLYIIIGKTKLLLHMNNMNYYIIPNIESIYVLMPDQLVLNSPQRI